jgi:HK97 family phage major capsid protein
MQKIRITELKDEKATLATRSKEIIEKAKSEKRMFNNEENEELGGIQARMAEINVEIEEKIEESRKQPVKREEKKMEKFSLRKAILAQMSGKAQGAAEQCVIDEAVKLNQRSGVEMTEGSLVVPISYRAALTAGGDTGVLVDEDQQELLFPLENALVLAQAGARYMTGLTGNITWPKATGANVYWEGENDEAADGANGFSKGAVFSPKRLTAYVDISKQLLIQENRDVEGIIRQLITNAIAQKLEATAFSDSGSDANTPDGIFASISPAAGTFDWATIVGMETSVDTSNALLGNLAYVMHPKLVGKAKTKVKDASGAGGFIYGNDGQNYMNGYKALRTNNVGGNDSDGYNVVYGNWDDFFIGQWGSVELLVDPYTQATKGMVRLVVNSYWNMGVIREESFAAAKLK